MHPHHLRAPAEDGGVLAQPPLSEAARLLEANRRRFQSWDYDFQGRRARQLRASARHEILGRSADYLREFGFDSAAPFHAEAPLLVTGHQPELFHPGVWVKNHALGGLAREHHAVGLNLIVDDDIPKGASIRIPTLGADGELRSTTVDFDEWALQTPYEDWRVRDEQRFATFPARVLETLGDLVPDPVMREFGPLLLETARKTDQLGLRFAAARRALETRWGLENHEIPLSTVSETESFLWFLSHLLAYLPRFQGVHNAALARYRSLYRIRSTHHPVPALGREGDWLEAPFWVWRADHPRRRPLLAKQLAKSTVLRISGEAEPFLEIPLGPDREACCAVDRLRELPARRIRLRTRALTTTMFARLLVGDLFIHGIGGAKYDELGDEITREFFHFEPPSYLTLSMTMWLGLPLDPACPNALRDVDRGLRDLDFNPDRHLGAELADEARDWVAKKRTAIAGPIATRADRVARFHEIRRANEALQGLVQTERRRLVAERASCRAGWKRNLVARSRDFSFVAHSSARLRAAFANVAPTATAAPEERAIEVEERRF
jgi:hypothetical protein